MSTCFDKSRWFILASFVFLVFLTPTFAQEETAQTLPDLEVITADNISSLELLKTLDYGSIVGLAFTPDGQQLVVSTEHGLWLFSTSDLTTEPEYVSSEYGGKLVFADDNILLMLGDSRASVWDFQEQSETAVLEGTHSAYNPVTDNITTLLDDETLYWSAQTGELIDRVLTSEIVSSVPFERPENSQMIYVSSSAISLDGHWEAFAGWGGVELFDLETGEGIAITTSCCDPAQETVTFSPDSDFLVIGDTNGGVDFWRIDPLIQVASVRHSQEIVDTVYSPTGDKLAVASRDGIINIWDVTSYELIETIEGFGGYAHSIALTPDNSRIITANADGTAWIWDMLTGELISTTSGPSFFVGYGTIPYASCLDITANGALLATGSVIDGRVRLWSPYGRRRGMFETGLGQDVNEVAFSPDGLYVAASGYPLHIWDLTTGEVVSRIDLRGNGYVTGLEFSPDSSTIAVGYNGGEVIVRDIETAAIIKKFDGMPEYATQLEFSNDGTLLATASDCWSCSVEERESHIFVWNVTTGEIVATLAAHDAFIKSLNFSKDGSLLLAAGQVEMMYFWSVDDNEVVHSIHQSVTSARFSINGRLLVTANRDGSVSVWGVPADQD